MRFKRAFSMTLVTQGVIFMLSLANGILLTRAIGANGRGVYSLVLASVTILSLFAGAGLNYSNTFFTGKDRGSVVTILSNSTIFWAAGAILLCLIYTVLPKSITDVVFNGVEEKHVKIVIALTVLTIASSYLTSINLGMQAFKHYNLFPLVQTIVFVLLNLLLLYVYNFGVTGAIYALCISLVISVSGNAIYTFRGIESFRFSPRWAQFWDSLKVGGRALTASLLGTLLIRSDIFLVNHFLGIKVAGIYSVAVFMAELIIKVPAIAGNVLFPKISKGVDQATINLTLRIARLSGLLSIIISVGVLIVGGYLLRLAFGNEFNDAYVPMVMLLPGVIALSFNVVLANYYAGMGYPFISILAQFVALITNIALNLFMIPHYGIIGAAISSSVAYIVMFLMIALDFSRRNSVPLTRIIINISGDLSILRNAWSARSIR